MKLTVEEFLNIKEKMDKYLQFSSNYYEIHKNGEDFNEEEFELNMGKGYLTYQEELLSHDLSDIPSSLWTDIEFWEDENHPVDFSKTKANIDFSLLGMQIEHGNFRGCNITNLDKLGVWINPKNFDQETIKNNPNLFLSDNFSDTFKEKYYNRELSINDFIEDSGNMKLPVEEFLEKKEEINKYLQDLSDYYKIHKNDENFNEEEFELSAGKGYLTSTQIEELENKRVYMHLSRELRNAFYDGVLSLDKIIDLYNYNKEEFSTIVGLLAFSNTLNFNGENALAISTDTFKSLIKDASVDKIKEVVYQYVRSNIITNHNLIDINKLPDMFIRENSDIFLSDEEDDLKERYYQRKLTADDVFDNIDLFQNMPVGLYFENYDYSFNKVEEKFGIGSISKMIKNHPDLMSYLISSGNSYKFNRGLDYSLSLEDAFIKNTASYILSLHLEGNNIEIPEWAKSFNFTPVYYLETNEQFHNLNNRVIIFNREERNMINALGIDNMKKFDEETGFFTHNFPQRQDELVMYEAVYLYLGMQKERISSFKDGKLPYEEFRKTMAKLIEEMRIKNCFTDYPDYSYMPNSFKEEFPNLFISEDAPQELKYNFYRNNITSENLSKNQNWFNYLIDKNLVNVIRGKYDVNIISLVSSNMQAMGTVNFIERYSSLFGNRATLETLSRYGSLSSDLTNGIFDFDKSKEEIDKQVRQSIYSRICKDVNLNYLNLISDKKFTSEHPDIFIDASSIPLSPNQQKQISTDFYNRNLRFYLFNKYPELVSVFKDKNLEFVFKKYTDYHQLHLYSNPSRYATADGILLRNDVDLIKVLGNEEFLNLCVKYGRYLENVTQDTDTKIYEHSSLEEIEKSIEEYIERLSLNGRYKGNFRNGAALNLNFRYGEDAPQFLKEKHPEIFLDMDAPEELKSTFYDGLTFASLKGHRDWLKYFEGKNVVPSFLKTVYPTSALSLRKYFEAFGQDKALRLGMNKTETVEMMIKLNKVDVMKKWYNALGGKFIPDFVVMKNMDVSDVDRFLSGSKVWSSLMRINGFSNNSESREAMLKLAYSFGVFDNDQRGSKELIDLLTNVPRNIKSDYHDVMEDIRREINSNSELRASLNAEGIAIEDDKDLFDYLYSEKENGDYQLLINMQRCPKSLPLVRNIFEHYPDSPVISPEKAHQLFGGFDMIYDKDFREFLLGNLDEVLLNPEYTSFISSVQKQFNNIKINNSNRHLTWDLAISFVQSNKYINQVIGNERLSKVSAIAGYSQEDFDTLQQIYAYGRTRVFNSIPRIENKMNGYSYEILRLDDPLALAIGTLSDCCQELGNAAEVSMEHSMVDKNGRVFVIKDEEGQIVAQSWVWRNKDVICFDNIEIPDKAFTRANRSSKRLSGSEFAKEVYDIYQQAAIELMEKDEETYLSLLEEGKITKQQYDNLRLSKVTVGLGYNDIADTLKKNSERDNGDVARPLEFKPPVNLNSAFYIKDSTVQYILEERKKDKNNSIQETIPIYHDEFTLHTDSDLTEVDLLTLEKLELLTKEDSNRTLIDSRVIDANHIATDLAYDYNLNPDTTRIIVNPNFAIIYDTNDDRVKIGDLLFTNNSSFQNPDIDIDTIIPMQINLALRQIGENKKIDISSLDDKQREMYQKASGILDSDIDRERGVNHAK